MWKEQLRPASFKGAPFFVEDHEVEIGRRLVVNEYPYRDEPYTEDLGAKANRYNITGYVIGHDYMEARDAILDAVEEGGAGVLIHPFLGTKNVMCENIRVRESKSEGGHAIFTLSFVKAGKKIFPNSTPVPSDLVSLQADSLIDLSRTNFIEEMVIAGVPEWVRDSYGADLSAAADIFDQIRQNGGINQQTTTALINQAAEWVADVADLSSPSLTLISDLGGAADRIIDSLKGVLELSPSIDTTIKNLEIFSDFTSIVSGGTTEQAKTADNNAATSENFIRIIALANETKAMADNVFTSYEDAITSRGNIFSRIDKIAGVTLDDNIYENLRQLRTEIANAVPGVDNSLPRISGFQLKQSLPSLVMAYDLYKNVDREQDIIDRNNIRHPSFMPGGERLSVLEYVEDTA